MIIAITSIISKRLNVFSIYMDYAYVSYHALFSRHAVRYFKFVFSSPHSTFDNSFISSSSLVLSYSPLFVQTALIGKLLTPCIFSLR